MVRRRPGRRQHAYRLAAGGPALELLYPARRRRQDGQHHHAFEPCAKYSNKVFADIPYLDVTAVLSDSGKTVVLNVVNRHETNAFATDIVLQNGAGAGRPTVKEINAE